MRIKKLHDWRLSYKKAIALQKRLAAKVRFTPVKKPLKIIAGLDCAFTRNTGKVIACVVVLRLPDFTLLETAYAVKKVHFPYIPGLLSFREAPTCLAAIRKLRTTPDAFLIDGQGIAHPRRLGIASHIGLFFNKPTIGCAKSRLIGTFEAPGSKKGEHSALRDNNEIIGAVLRTRTDVKPLFVSVGHKCTLEDAINVTLACTTRYRLPEPARLAHQLVTKLTRQLS